MWQRKYTNNNGGDLIIANAAMTMIQRAKCTANDTKQTFALARNRGRSE